MKQINFKMITRQVSYGFIAAVMLMSYFPNMASAASITTRSVILGSSVASASTTYDFTFTIPNTTAVIQSVEIKACQEASGGCTAATGFDASSASMTGQPTNMGDAGGWSETSVTGALRIAKTGNVADPSLSLIHISEPT